jgi:hypothetical protein
MNNKFDELAKGMAQSVSRRQALKKFGVGLAGLALALLRSEATAGRACFGLARSANAANCKASGKKCDPNKPSACCSGICRLVQLPGPPRINPTVVCYCA